MRHGLCLRYTMFEVIEVRFRRTKHLYDFVVARGSIYLRSYCSRCEIHLSVFH